MSAEETADFWITKGYSKSDAEKIAAWCKTNQTTPTPDTITKIILAVALPYKTAAYTYAELLKTPNLEQIERSFKEGVITEDQAISVLLKLGYTSLDGRTLSAKWRREITPAPLVKPDYTKVEAALRELEKVPGWQTKDINGFTIANQKSTNPANQATTRDEAERKGWTTYNTYTYTFAGWQTVYAWAGWKAKPVTAAIAEETKEFWTSLGYKEADAIKIADWCRTNKMTPIPEKIAELIAPAKITYKALPTPPTTFPVKFLPYYKELDDACAEKSSAKVLSVLRKYAWEEASPIAFLPAILAIAGIAALIATIVGTYPFAQFIYEEALQTIDMAFYTAQKEGYYDLAQKALNKKKELFNPDIIRSIGDAIPFVNVLTALNVYMDFSKAKLEIDQELLNRKAKEVVTATAGDISSYITALDEGKDPTEYLPKIIEPEAEGKHERIYATVRDIIDGDTIDVGMIGKDAVTGEGVKLREYSKTGHARVRIVGINAPEKSPKGEILCTGIEIYKVEPTYADQARDRFLPLNDKEVTIKLDPANVADGFGRLLAVVEYAGTDIGLRQIKEGLACYYFRTAHKYVNDNVYKSETEKAAAAGVGMWTAVKVTEAGKIEAKPEFEISITSSPSNAKIYMDNVYTHHLTPSDEAELKDVMRLFAPGIHTLKITKGTLMAEKVITIVEGDNGSIAMDLETPGLPAVEVVAVAPLVTPEIAPPAVLPAVELSAEQRAVIKMLLDEIAAYTAERKVLTEKERLELVLKYLGG